MGSADAGDPVGHRAASRRLFVKQAGVGAALALGLPACISPEREPEDSLRASFYKDTSPFIQHGQNNLENENRASWRVYHTPSLFFRS